MKLIYSILGLILFTSVSAQVSIGKEAVDGDGLLDFGDASSQALILPATSNATGVAGTITFDRESMTVKAKDNLGWAPISEEGVLPEGYTYNGQEVGTSVVIGAEEAKNGADGVLVLESDNKALILPKVANPSATLKSPHPGTICYDTITKSLAVFNGVEWTFLN